MPIRIITCICGLLILLTACGKKEKVQYNHQVFFTGTPRAGCSPLKVQFSDKSTTNYLGGIHAWAWDFDGDGKTDSTSKNPSFTYPPQGTKSTYTVTLSTWTARTGWQKNTRTAFITVDPEPEADFSFHPGQGLQPLVVTFKDQSRHASAWKWDLNGDRTWDATCQHPEYTYTRPGIYSVTLEVTNISGNARITKTDCIKVGTRTTNTLAPAILQYQCNEIRGQYTVNTASTSMLPGLGTVSAAFWQKDPGRPGFSGPEPGAGCLGQSAVIDTGWRANLRGDVTFMWWHCLRTPSFSPGTGAAFFGDHTGYCYTAGISPLTNTASICFHGTTLGALQAKTEVQKEVGKWQHIALVINDQQGLATWYFDGQPEAPITFNPQSFGYGGGGGTDNFKVGQGGHYPAATNFYYIDDFRIYAQARTGPQIRLDMQHEVATASSFARGCPGPAGTPILGANSPPTAGNSTFALTLEYAGTACPGLLLLGLSTKEFQGMITLPFHLGMIYGQSTDCQLHTGFITAIPLHTTSTITTIPLPLPREIAGYHAYGQALLLDTPGATTAGLDLNIQNT